MKVIRVSQRLLCGLPFWLLLLGHFCTSALHARPRPPLPPWPGIANLCSESFDQPAGFAADQTIDPGVWAESWSGYCLDRTSSAVVPWSLPMETADRTLVDASGGAIRFWYRPLFDPTTGPGHVARLLTLVSAAGDISATWFSLALSADGQRLSLACGEEPTPCLQSRVTLQPGEWVLLTLGYSSTNSALFIDDALVASGPGLPPVPAQAVPHTALIIGSAPNGQQPAAGQIDELTTFGGHKRFRLLTDCPFGLSPDFDIAAYWRSCAAMTALGPISEAEDAARQAQLAARSTGRLNRSMSGNGPEISLDGGGGDGPQGTTPSPCGTNAVYNVWITNSTREFVAGQGLVLRFQIGGGTNGVLYDVFGTTNLVGYSITNSQWYWLTNGYACDTIVLTNQPLSGAYYILGTPLDTDTGLLSDAWEHLVTGGDVTYSNDDRLTPLVGITALDSVALEGSWTNTASFLVSRLGGYLKQPLTLNCLLSGTATYGPDYTMAPVTNGTSATNVLITIPAHQTSVIVTLTALNDTNAEGSETATLTLATNSTCEVDLAHASATAWILEDYTFKYTTTSDFRLGVLAGLEAVAASDDGHIQFKTDLPPQFPFINIACTGRGTVARINTTNGQVVGEYRTAPLNVQFTGADGNGPQPSRTTVDLYGNVWVANRNAV